MPTSGAAALFGQLYERIVLKLFEPRSHLDQQQQMMKRASNFGFQIKVKQLIDRILNERGLLCSMYVGAHTNRQSLAKQKTLSNNRIAILQAGCTSIIGWLENKIWHFSHHQRTCGSPRHMEPTGNLQHQGLFPNLQRCDHSPEAAVHASLTGRAECRIKHQTNPAQLLELSAAGQSQLILRNNMLHALSPSPSAAAEVLLPGIDSHPT
jgi:hypothetical protein